MLSNFSIMPILNFFHQQSHSTLTKPSIPEKIPDTAPRTLAVCTPPTHPQQIYQIAFQSAPINKIAFAVPVTSDDLLSQSPQIISNMAYVRRLRVSRISSCDTENFIFSRFGGVLDQYGSRARLSGA